MVALGLVPDVDWRSRDEGFREDLETSDVLADVIGLMCDCWDMLMERVQSESVQVVDVCGAGRKFLRLVTVDVSLRMFALARLAEVELPDSHVPLWARSNGAGQILRELQREVGLNRDHLAARLEVWPTTVDNWLDGRNFPSSGYVPILAKELSRGPVAVHDLELRLRREFELARLAAAVAAVVGWDDVAADVEAASRFVRLMQESDELTALFEEMAEADEFAGFDMPDKPGKIGSFLVPLLVLTGSFAPFAPRLLWSLAKSPEVRDWSDDVYAVASSMELQLRLVAGSHSEGRAAAGLAQDYFDVVIERTPEDLEAAEAIRTTLSGELKDVFPLTPEMDGVPNPFSVVARSVRLKRSLVRHFTGSADAHYQLGSMLGSVGSRIGDRELVNEGIMECKVAVGMEPRWDAPAVEPGIILCNLEDWDGALRELAKAADSLPRTTPHLWNVRGYALMNAGFLEESLVDYRAVFEARPDFATAWGYAAHCAFSLGNGTEGLKYAKTARTQGDPSVYDAWENGAYRPRRKKRST